VEFYDFLLQIVRDVTGLIIILGLLLFVISFVKISGKIELLNPNDCNKCRAIGAIFLIIGFGALVYPKTITVHGKITYGDGKAANSVKVLIQNASTFTNSEGIFELDDVPRNANSMDFVFPQYTLSKGLSVPFYKVSQDVSFCAKTENCTIKGRVSDRFDNPLDLPLTVQVRTVDNYSLPKLVDPSTGNYELSGIPIDPKNKNEISVKSKSFIYSGNNASNAPLIIAGPYNLIFSKNELQEKFKNYDIIVNLGNTIDVSGKVEDYCGEKRMRPEPVIGALIEMGGRENLTNENGEYLISRVPKETAFCKIKLISGIEKTKEITPPLNESLPSDKNARRLFIICIND
jgi:hypothetical protein